MTTFNRVRAAWTGFVGSPGVSTFACTDPETFLPALHDFFAAIDMMLPNDVTIDIGNTGDVVTTETGEVVGVWSTDAPGLVNGTSSNAYMAPAGGQVRWLTGTFVGGRQLIGRTFIVPMITQDYFGTAGDMTGGLDILQTAANGLLSGASENLQVWSRPAAAHGTHSARVGSMATVTSAVVPAKVAVLRTRRD